MGERDTNVDSPSHKALLKKVQSVLDTTSTSSEVNRQLMDSPVNLINGVLKDDEEMCLTLTGGHNDPVDLQVCDESDEWQKWLFHSDSTSSGPIQSLFDNDLCLNGGNNSSDFTPLMSSVCNETALSQQWSLDGEGISDGLFGKFMSVRNGCEGVEGSFAQVLLQNHLGTRYVHDL